MVKKILVFGSLSTMPGETEALADTAVFFKQAQGHSGVETEVSYAHLDEVSYLLEDKRAEIIDLRNDSDFKSYDLVILRGKLAAPADVVPLVSNYLRDNGVPVINSAYGLRRPIGKVPQMYNMMKLDLPYPKTVSAPRDNMVELVEKNFQYPVVIKDVQGSHGNNNFLARDRHHLENILKQNQHVRFMVQQFVPNDGDMRILIAGLNEMVILRQSAAGTHLNNTSKGGSASLVSLGDVDQKILDGARKLSKFCDYEVSGVDVIIDSSTGRYYFLEINSQPQLKTGVFLEAKKKFTGEYLKTLLD